MATTIRLNASELAVITGHNKYQDINELTEKILIRNRLKKGEIIRTDIQKNLVQPILPELLLRANKLKHQNDQHMIKERKQFNKKITDTQRTNKINNKINVENMKKKLKDKLEDNEIINNKCKEYIEHCKKKQLEDINKLEHNFTKKENKKLQEQYSKTEQQKEKDIKITIKTIKKELKLPEHSSKKDIEEKIKTMCIAPQLDKQTEQESHANLHKILEQTPVVKKLLEKSTYSDLIKARGTHNEEYSLNHSEKKNKIVIQKRNNRLYTRVLYSDDVCIIIVQGKIDGMIGTDTVVESKNRSRRLFYKIPAYEKVQLEAYLYLTQTKKALHIENYNEMTNEQYYDHDKLFWDECSEKLITYVTHKLLSM
jgi:hypothetical protein